MAVEESDLDKKALQVATNLGIAMAQWGNVENELYLLFCALCGSGPFPNATSVIYETVVHLDTKVNIIDALIEFRLSDDVALGDWRTLENHLRRKIRRVRNKLAHWRVWRDRAKGTAFLGPPLYQPSTSTSDALKGAMSADDIMQHALRFEGLADEIKNFRDKHVVVP